VIIKFVLSEFKKKEGVDLSEDKIALQRIREAGENAKHILSSMESGIEIPSNIVSSQCYPAVLLFDALCSYACFCCLASITLPYIKVDKSGKALNLDVELTRAKFEDLCANLIERSIAPCKSALLSYLSSIFMSSK